MQFYLTARVIFTTISTYINVQQMIMAQHFLLSAQARTLSLRKIFSLSDDQAFEMFKQSRWGHHDAICPCCGSVAKHYFIKTRRQWRCRDCNHTFSVTSGTIFASHKLPLKVYLAAIAIYCNAVKGLSALQLARTMLISSSSVSCLGK